MLILRIYKVSTCLQYLFYSIPPNLSIDINVALMNLCTPSMDKALI